MWRGAMARAEKESHTRLVESRRENKNFILVSRERAGEREEDTSHEDVSRDIIYFHCMRKT